MELILGLRADEPVRRRGDADVRRVPADAERRAVHRAAARVPLDEMNAPTAFGAQASLRMNLDEADMAPELELNEIIWRSVRGADSPMPPPSARAFVDPRAPDGEMSGRRRSADKGGAREGGEETR